MVPYKPNRIAIIMLGFVLASGAGLGIAALREASDRTIKNSKDIKKFEGVDLLTIMPYTPTKEERRGQWIKRFALVTGCIVFIGLALTIVHQLVLPLNDLFTIVIERLAA
jgi:cell division septal protein FtsQ